ncbi:hypothetical protein YC2023_088759 [Brassica napus]
MQLHCLAGTSLWRRNCSLVHYGTTGFSLNSSESRVISIPASWSGRIWGRTLCSQNPTTGKFTCVTGDCGSSKIECSGAGGKPPATIAEFTLNGASNLDFFDISLVDGYNIPVTIVPYGGAAGVGKCMAAGCAADLNVVCPPQLKLTMEDTAGVAVACKSACEAFGTPEFCCSGAFGTPDTCKASEYAGFFKKACPTAYSYAYDDGTSTFTCSGADYVITFWVGPDRIYEYLEAFVSIRSLATLIFGDSDIRNSCGYPNYLVQIKMDNE